MTSPPFSKVLAKLGKQSLYVLDLAISKSEYVALDLSVTNEALKNVDVSSSETLDAYINNHIKSNNAKVSYGGYLETRNIYRRSTYFNDTNPDTERNIHLGLDFWIAADTPIYTPLDAVVHSFKNNINFGDYGPTIILKHTIDEIEFYTLYGHLSLASIEDLSIGQAFQKGDQIATLGDASVNGDYPPHLHFQIIKDLQGYVGDYPGVCSKVDLEFFSGNCADGGVVLGLA
jgi:murein DD-endopeptidase MepM/ murein hydrolase activator NlpD